MSRPVSILNSIPVQTYCGVPIRVARSASEFDAIYGDAQTRREGALGTLQHDADRRRVFPVGNRNARYVMRGFLNGAWLVIHAAAHRAPGWDDA